jgi:hypothetical protein
LFAGTEKEREREGETQNEGEDTRLLLLFLLLLCPLSLFPSKENAPNRAHALHFRFDSITHTHTSIIITTHTHIRTTKQSTHQKLLLSRRISITRSNTHTDRHHQP